MGYMSHRHIITYLFLMCFSAAKVEIPVPPARTLELINERKHTRKLQEIDASYLEYNYNIIALGVVFCITWPTVVFRIQQRIL